MYVFSYSLARFLSDSMGLTNIQPTTSIGGQQAGGMPGASQGLGQRESAQAVLSTMLETPALPRQLRDPTYNLCWVNS